MALIKYSGNIAWIRGRVRGSIYQVLPAGNIFRSQQGHIHPDSPRQVKSKAIQARLQQEWAILSNDQRNRWEALARYAPQHTKKQVDKFLNGHQAFLKLNHNRLEYDLTVLTDPAFNKCDITPVEASLSLSAGNLTLTLDRAADATKEFVILFVSFKVKPTWNNPRSTRKLLKFTTTNTDTFNINAEYLSLFGVQLVGGDTIFFKYTNADKRSGLQFPYKSGRVTL